MKPVTFPPASLPVTNDLALAYRLSIAVAALMAVASAAGIMIGLGGLYGAARRGHRHRAPRLRRTLLRAHRVLRARWCQTPEFGTAYRGGCWNGAC